MLISAHPNPFNIEKINPSINGSESIIELSAIVILSIFPPASSVVILSEFTAKASRTPTGINKRIKNVIAVNHFFIIYEKKTECKAVMN